MPKSAANKLNYASRLWHGDVLLTRDEARRITVMPTGQHRDN